MNSHESGIQEERENQGTGAVGIGRSIFLNVLREEEVGSSHCIDQELCLKALPTELVH